MGTFFSRLFDSSDFPARWQCGRWPEELGWLHIISDLGTWTAYVAIPIVLVLFTWRRRDIPFRKIFLLFGAFILACGTTHLIEVIIFWWPIYRLAGLVKAFTAVVSWGTVAALVPIVPQALALRSPKELEREIAEREKAERSLREARDELERRVQARTADLAHANDELRDRNREMEQFVYTVSHDLKSPLVTATGFLGMLREDVQAGRTDDVLDSLDRLERANKRMGQLIDDLLALSRIGRVQNRVELIDTAVLVRELIDDLLERIKAAGATVTVRTLPPVLADRTRVREVFENLVTNALKYGSDTPNLRIEIEGFADGREVRYHVRDNGPGIDPEFHERIFRLFQRLDTKHEGTGVGLAIVRRILEVHGGRAGVESEAGQGATFWVSFPAEGPPFAESGTGTGADGRKADPLSAG